MQALRNLMNLGGSIILKLVYSFNFVYLFIYLFIYLPIQYVTRSSVIKPYLGRSSQQTPGISVWRLHTDSVNLFAMLLFCSLKLAVLELFVCLFL